MKLLKINSDTFRYIQIHKIFLEKRNAERQKKTIKIIEKGGLTRFWCDQPPFTVIIFNPPFPESAF